MTTDRPPMTELRIGDWSVNAATHELSRDGRAVRLEARTLRLLLALAERAGETISPDELMDRVWSETIVTQDSIYQAVTSLRRVLGDDPKKPTYIVTVPRRGYRMIAPVTSGAQPSPMTQPSSMAQPVVGPELSSLASAAAAPHAPWRRRAGALLGAAAIVVLAFGLALWKLGIGMKQDQHLQSLAVLPFLDLTSQAMDEEYFADGMTEELIGKLSHTPGLRVSSATDSFYFKGRSLPVSTIATTLNVAYVLDGSVRRSGPTLRVAVRLVRANDGFVVWSETYDRRFEDLVAVQENIANEVAKVLPRSLQK